MHRPPKVFVRGLWKVFLDSAADIERAIRYVENNPLREGLPPQCWPSSGRTKASACALRLNASVLALPFSRDPKGSAESLPFSRDPQGTIFSG